MKSLLIITLIAYAVAAIHALLAFINKRRSAERTALYTLAAAFTAHTVALALDWIQNGHYPLFGLRETFSFLAWTLVVAFGLALYRYHARALGALTLPIVTLLLLVAILVHAGDNAAANSITQGVAVWLFPVHTTLLVCAYAAFFVVFAASLMYLWQGGEFKLKTFSGFFPRLPSLSTVDDIGATAVGIGFTLLSLGILTGIIWSSERSGRMWHNDPIEFFALSTWVLYLALLHYRAQWRGRKAAWLGVAGFALVVCTFVGAVLLGGFHMFG